MFNKQRNKLDNCMYVAHQGHSKMSRLGTIKNRGLDIKNA